MMPTCSKDSYFGYPVPNCCLSSCDAERFFCEDLNAMGRGELECERSALSSTLHSAAIHGATRAPKVFAPDGNPRPFGTWARWRIERIDHLLGAKFGKGLS